MAEVQDSGLLVVAPSLCYAVSDFQSRSRGLYGVRMLFWHLNFTGCFPAAEKGLHVHFLSCVICARSAISLVSGKVSNLVCVCMCARARNLCQAIRLGDGGKQLNEMPQYA